MTTRPRPNESHRALPAEKKTNSGSSAIAALGARLATDWASTSGVDRTRALSAILVPVSGPVVAAMQLPYLLAALVAVGRRRVVEARVARDEPPRTEVFTARAYRRH